MKCMILAAGFGKRLVPLTLGRAKPSIPFLNKPFLVHIAEHLARHGVMDLIVNLHHLPESIKSLTSLIPRDSRICFVEEKREILGTAGGLKNAETFLSDDTFLLINSDILFTVDLQKILRFHREKRALATMVLRENPDPRAFPPIVTDGASRVVQVAGRPESPGAAPAGREHLFTGIHVLDPRIFAYIPPDRPFEIIREVYPAMIAANEPVFGVVTEAFWCEAGTLARFIASTRAALQALDLPRPLVAESASLEPGARVDPFSVIGPCCRVSDGAVVASSVLLENVDVGAGAVIERTIVDRDIPIEPGRVVRDMCLSLDPGSGRVTAAPIG